MTDATLGNSAGYRSLLLILNGRAAEDPELRSAVERLRAAGHRVEVRVIWEPADTPKFAEQGAREGFDAVVAAGGDGTLNQVLGGILAGGCSTETILGVLPYGTANDFAAGCRLPLDDPGGVLSLIANGPPRRVDAGTVNGRPFINVATGGYGAEVTTGTPVEMKSLLGGFAYFLTGLANVTSLVPKQTRLVAEDLEWEGRLLGLAVGNGRQAGGGFQVCPDAQLDDGLLDVLVIPDVEWHELTTLIDDLRQLGQRPDFQRIIYRRARWLEVEARDGLQVNLDGEPLAATHFRFETLPRCVQVCLPEDTPVFGRAAV